MGAARLDRDQWVWLQPLLDRPPALVIVTHDSLGDLRENFGRLIAVASELGARVVVVDNASTDDTQRYLRSFTAAHPGLRIVAWERNRGYAAAVNRAAREVPDTDLLVLNPDVELTEATAVLKLAAVLRDSPSVAVVAPRLVGADGEPQQSARVFPSLLTLLAEAPGVGRLAPAKRSRQLYGLPSSSYTRCTVDWVIGGAMLIRREAFERVGGFDERYFLYVEDMDFCRRCVRDGWDVTLFPSVTLRHGYRRASRAENGSLVKSKLRRWHLTGHARHFIREPRLLFGRGRGLTRALPPSPAELLTAERQRAAGDTGPRQGR
jgi:GT2 family glycosyltransferase